jgi:hypothetical protein
MFNKDLERKLDWANRDILNIMKDITKLHELNKHRKLELNLLLSHLGLEIEAVDFAYRIVKVEKPKEGR